ncbi:phosphate acyltransferase [Vibrio sp. HA2012]|uniref:phosphate acyltransferase n=1 Tax=Vibrio sp. HA2012 TaxID=1971595 RepID=UPI0018E236EF|nr:phosphate acyltransferase [Vibrio sp. HA2012]
MFTTPIQSFAELRDCAVLAGPKRVCVVQADDPVALEAAAGALDLGMADITLVGDKKNIICIAEKHGHFELLDRATLIDSELPQDTAARLAADGAADILLKGHLRTDQLLKSVLNKELGLRTGRLLSDVLLYEDQLSQHKRLVGITDGGLNVAPTLEQKKSIVENAIEVMHSIGLREPLLAVLSATEAVSEGVPSTLDAQALSAMSQAGEFGAAQVFGPLALDNALLISAAKAKGISNPVAGRADCLVLPSVEAGNVLGKSVKFIAQSACAHVVVGAKVPILIPSRVESAEDKVNSIALGVLNVRN